MHYIKCFPGFWHFQAGSATHSFGAVLQILMQFLVFAHLCVQCLCAMPEMLLVWSLVREAQVNCKVLSRHLMKAHVGGSLPIYINHSEPEISISGIKGQN